VLADEGILASLAEVVLVDKEARHIICHLLDTIDVLWFNATHAHDRQLDLEDQVLAYHCKWGVPSSEMDNRPLRKVQGTEEEQRRHCSPSAREQRHSRMPPPLVLRINTDELTMEKRPPPQVKRERAQPAPPSAPQRNNSETAGAGPSHGDIMLTSKVSGNKESGPLTYQIPGPVPSPPMVPEPVPVSADEDMPGKMGDNCDDEASEVSDELGTELDKTPHQNGARKQHNKKRAKGRIQSACDAELTTQQAEAVRTGRIPDTIGVVVRNSHTEHDNRFSGTLGHHFYHLPKPTWYLLERVQLML
jgi:hypothetical protein